MHQKAQAWHYFCPKSVQGAIAATMQRRCTMGRERMKEAIEQISKLFELMSHFCKMKQKINVSFNILTLISEYKKYGFFAWVSWECRRVLRVNRFFEALCINYQSWACRRVLQPKLFHSMDRLTIIWHIWGVSKTWLPQAVCRGTSLQVA